MNKARLKIAKRDIESYFDGLDSRIFKRSDIEKIIAENRDFWRMAISTTTYQFIQFLLKETQLKEVKLKFPKRAEIRYTWGEVPFFEVVLSVRPRAYFSHYTAVYFHGLTDQIPKILYTNFEQSPKRAQDTGLVQDRIDLAFGRKPRVSNTIANYKNYKICLINGKHTGELGVIDFKGPDDERLRITNIERTLIDITVRPFYSGGVMEVLNAFRLAKDKVSLNKLNAMLKEINYIYPYRQAVGFYLEKSGVYNDSLVSLFENPQFEFDFYLAHGLDNKSYNTRWHLYYPKGF